MGQEARLTVTGLGAASRFVAELITVAALHLCHVLRLRALTRGVALTIAVAADNLLLLGAVASPVTFLATVVAAAAAATLGAIAGEMSHLRNGCQLRPGREECDWMDNLLSSHFRH